MAKITTRVDALLPGDVIDASDFDASNTPTGWHWSQCSAHWSTTVAKDEACECQRRNGLIRHDVRDTYHEAQHCFRVNFSYAEEKSGCFVAVEKGSDILGERGYIWPRGDVKIVVNRSA